MPRRAISPLVKNGSPAALPPPIKPRSPFRGQAGQRAKELELMDYSARYRAASPWGLIQLRWASSLVQITKHAFGADYPRAGERRKFRYKLRIRQLRYSKPPLLITQNASDFANHFNTKHFCDFHQKNFLSIISVKKNGLFLKSKMIWCIIYVKYYLKRQEWCIISEKLHVCNFSEIMHI